MGAWCIVRSRLTVGMSRGADPSSVATAEPRASVATRDPSATLGDKMDDKSDAMATATTRLTTMEDGHEEEGDTLATIPVVTRAFDAAVRLIRILQTAQVK